MLRPRVQFTLFDGMVLVAAMALGLGLARAIDPNGLAPRHGYVLRWVFYGPIPCLASAGALGLVTILLHRPRALRRRLLRQPGLVACAVSLASIGVAFVGNLGFLWSLGVRPTRFSLLSVDYWFACSGRTPEFVIGAWLCLWITGRWRGGENWIDRAGRVVGGFWIAQYAYTGLYAILHFYFPTIF